MPCSLCGKSGHNKRTCPSKDLQIKKDKEKEKENDQILVILYTEQALRNAIINDKITEFTDEKNNYYQSILGIKKKEFKFINLDKISSLNIFIVNGNSNVIELPEDFEDTTWVGKLGPRSIVNITTYTGYRYILMDDYSLYDTVDITEDMEDLQLINYTIDYHKPSKVLNCKELNSENKALFSALKMNFLLKEIIRMGGMNHDNLEPILDLHQDITLPEHDIIDLEAAGVPNEFSNIT